ncbi:MAG: hypothetical protein F4Y41_02635 [Gammaproteobacteria bacterium]|nr:hypothetical protein [Gammaproteobacteria bacterium]
MVAAIVVVALPGDLVLENRQEPFHATEVLGIGWHLLAAPVRPIALDLVEDHRGRFVFVVVVVVAVIGVG